MNKLVTRRTTGIGVLLLLMSLVIAVGLPVAATNDNCTAQKGGWDVGVTSGPWGSLTNNGGSVSLTLNAGYSLELCVKGGNGFVVYNVTSSGGPFWPPADCGNARNPQQCGLSHWGIRNVVFTTTTTTQPTTTTTQPTTTTTQPTTTTTQPTTTTTHHSTTTTQPHTTTTTQPHTTTTTQPTTTTTQATTTTTQATTTTAGPTTTTTQATTTTAGPTTTTAGPTTTQPPTLVTAPQVGVLGVQVSAPAQVNQVTQETLPFTGISTGSLALLATAFAGVGLLLLLAARQNDEKNPARSWN